MSRQYPRLGLLQKPSNAPLTICSFAHKNGSTVTTPWITVATHRIIFFLVLLRTLRLNNHHLQGPRNSARSFVTFKATCPGQPLPVNQHQYWHQHLPRERLVIRSASTPSRGARPETRKSYPRKKTLAHIILTPGPRVPRDPTSLLPSPGHSPDNRRFWMRPRECLPLAALIHFDRTLTLLRARPSHTSPPGAAENTLDRQPRAFRTSPPTSTAFPAPEHHLLIMAALRGDPSLLSRCLQEDDHLPCTWTVMNRT
jgi:hypothetical protein